MILSPNFAGTDAVNQTQIVKRKFGQNIKKKIQQIKDKK